jgi:hypothetical protein
MNRLSGRKLNGLPGDFLGPTFAGGPVENNQPTLLDQQVVNIARKLLKAFSPPSLVILDFQFDDVTAVGILDDNVGIAKSVSELIYKHNGPTSRKREKSGKKPKVEKVKDRFEAEIGLEKKFLCC